jgi:type I restriction enzyme S subunit
LLIGYAAIVPNSFTERGIASHHIYILRVKLGSPVTNTFLYHLLNSRQMHDVVSGYANGTTVNMLPVDAVQKPLILLPPPRLLQRFHEFASNVERSSEEMVCETQTLRALRDALLPKLVSGEIRVKHAEKIVGEAL